MDIREILERVKSGALTVEEAESALKTAPFADLGYAKVDTHRRIRQGAAEVVYGAGKTAEQISGIVKALTESGAESVLVTRLDEEKASSIEGITYNPRSKTAVFGKVPEIHSRGEILIVTAGTSDIPVAEEAASTCAFYGREPKRIYDAGVAGIHRLLAHKDEIAAAKVIIAVAGMEGALASVLGGMADCPVIAVPTSVGYGASFGGLTALLAMMNSCSAGVSVVNIDNGFGAGFLACRILRK